MFVKFSNAKVIDHSAGMRMASGLVAEGRWEQVDTRTFRRDYGDGFYGSIAVEYGMTRDDDTFYWTLTKYNRIVEQGIDYFLEDAELSCDEAYEGETGKVATRKRANEEDYFDRNDKPKVDLNGLALGRGDKVKDLVDGEVYTLVDEALGGFYAKHPVDGDGIYISTRELAEMERIGTRVKRAESASDGRKCGSFTYTPNTDGKYLYVAVRACTADVPNLNFDMLPHDELKTAYKTFIGSSVFMNHDNQDPEKARGVIIDAAYHTEDEDDKWVEILMEMDEERAPKLCSLIRSGEIDTVSMGCFTPGTKITLGDGTTKVIEDIQVGDVVLTHEGNVKPVIATMVHKHDGIVYEVSSYAQPTPMRLTEEHPVWVRRPARAAHDTVRGRIERNKGEQRHTCLCGRDFSTASSLSAHLREVERWGHDGEHGRPPEFEGWVEAKDLEIGDYVLDPTVVGVDGGDIAFARLLGYYLAEGNFGYDKNRNLPDGAPAFVEWNFHENEVEYHQEVMELIEALGYKPVGPYFKNTCATIRCNSPELAALMLEHGGKYSWGKKISQEVMRWGVDAQYQLLEAYLNGDGHYGGTHQRDEHFSFATVSKDLAEQIFTICVRCGVRCTEPACRDYSDRAKDSIKNGGTVERRPRYEAQGVLGEIDSRSKRLAYVDESGLWRRVTKIRMLEYSGDVYNFEVADDNSYVAEGCAVHNCNVESTTCSVCGNVAEYPFQFCSHIQQKGREFGGKLAYEICNGIEFFEESWVYDPADPTAYTREVAASKKAASRKLSYDYASYSPDSVWSCLEEGYEGEYTLDELKKLYDDIVDKAEYPEFDDWEWDATRSGWLRREASGKTAGSYPELNDAVDRIQMELDDPDRDYHNFGYDLYYRGDGSIEVKFLDYNEGYSIYEWEMGMTFPVDIFTEAVRKMYNDPDFYLEPYDAVVWVGVAVKDRPQEIGYEVNYDGTDYHFDDDGEMWDFIMTNEWIAEAIRDNRAWITTLYSDGSEEVYRFDETYSSLRTPRKTSFANESEMDSFIDENIGEFFDRVGAGEDAFTVSMSIATRAMSQIGAERRQVEDIRKRLIRSLDMQMVAGREYVLSDLEELMDGLYYAPVRDMDTLGAVHDFYLFEDMMDGWGWEIKDFAGNVLDYSEHYSGTAQDALTAFGNYCSTTGSWSLKQDDLTEAGGTAFAWVKRSGIVEEFDSLQWVETRDINGHMFSSEMVGRDGEYVTFNILDEEDGDWSWTIDDGVEWGVSSSLDEAKMDIMAAYIRGYLGLRVDYDYWGNPITGAVESNDVLSPRVPDDIADDGDDGACPLCGSESFDGEICDVCGYQEPPEGFDDIDIEHEDDDEEEGEEPLDEMREEPMLDERSAKALTLSDIIRIAASERMFDISSNPDGLLRMCEEEYEGEYELIGFDTIATSNGVLQEQLQAEGAEEL